MMNHFNGPIEDLGCSNTESLYSKSQRVYLKTKNNEERQREVRVTVQLLSGLSPVTQQNLSVQLTDDEDPFFLYSLLITEDDFKCVKSQQGLLVDFDHFPRQFIRLLEQCKSVNENGGPRFLLILDGDFSEPHLKIVETNHFKHLCHLDLRIGCGSDEEIKKLMAVKIRHMKEAYLLKEKELNLISSQLTECSRRYDCKSQELDKMQHEWCEEKNSLFTRHMSELSKEREKLSTAQADLKIEWERDRRDLELKHQKAIRDVEEQVNYQTVQHQTLLDKNCREESAKREMSGQLESSQNEVAMLQRDNSALRKQNSKLDHDYHEQEKVTINIRNKLSMLEQDYKEKTHLLNKQQELLLSANNQKSKMEESLLEKETVLNRKVTHLKTVIAELVKANHIITNQHADLAATKSKLALRTNIVFEQERKLELANHSLTDATLKLDISEKKCKELEISEMKLKENVLVLEGKIEVKDKQIVNNDNVIRWLNKQLSEIKSEAPESTSTPSRNNYIRGPPMTLRMPVESIKHFHREQVRNDGANGTTGTYKDLPLNTNILLGKKSSVLPTTIASAYFPKLQNQLPVHNT